MSERPGRLSGNIAPELSAEIDRAGALSRERFGRRVDFFLPGMFLLHGETGLYPAVSLTGGRCDLQCEHCRGRLLAPMIPALDPESLVAAAQDLKQRGRIGLLVSGGADPEGRLPWRRFVSALETISRRIGLIVTVHAGYLDRATALELKNAGVRQALVDVMGDDGTARRVYHLKRGTAPVWETLDALAAAGLETAPHVVVGLDYGKIVGEYEAVRRLAAYRPARLVTVVLNPQARTPMRDVSPPPVEETARFLAEARVMLPEARHHLGCARPGGAYRRVLDRLALRAGINALALPGDDARDEALRLGLETTFTRTCCSLAGEPDLDHIEANQKESGK